MTTLEHQRLKEVAEGAAEWRKWGPYLSERQWGTVREDYSADGDAWRYFTHDQARSRAYRWGEDGLAGFSDDHQLLCFALALWNGKDPILKERLFGLGNAEGNHGETVKESFYHLDALPTYAYAAYLYKYPQAAFPYLDLVAANAGRGPGEPAYELADTGAFAEDRYFDVLVEYAKDGPEDILIAISVTNRGPEQAALTVLPTLWFRNTWSWSDETPKPNLKQVEKKSPASIVAAVHAELGVRYLYCAGAPPVLFTENETNNRRLFGGDNAGRFVKDGINDSVVGGAKGTVNPKRTGTKAAVRYDLVLEPGESRELRLRLADGTPASSDRAGGPFVGFDAILSARRAEADAFYASLLPSPAGDAEAATILRRACAGILWNAQFYHFDAARWLAEHGAGPGGASQRLIRNVGWSHLACADVVTVPDKWEYPWCAAWNLAFHAATLAMLDEALAKRQLCLLLEGGCLHPNGKLPASEWDFQASEPPVHAWAVWSVFRADRARRGDAGDLAFLRRAFPGLLRNFTWWANRIDAEGLDLLSGGLVGIDAIAVFDRAAATASGPVESSTASAWMAFQCAHMLQIAVELAVDDPQYEPFAVSFFDHLMTVAQAIEHMAGGDASLWNEADGWYYDLIRLQGGTARPLPARGFAGLVPILSCAVVAAEALERMPRLEERLRRFSAGRPEASARAGDPARRGHRDRRLVAVAGEARLRRVLARVLDEAELLSGFGVRSLSQAHALAPARTALEKDVEITVAYEAGEARDAWCAGNVTWRGPVWLPLNALLIDALLQQYLYYGNRFRLECPTGSGQRLTLYEIAEVLTARLTALFRADADGARPEPAAGGASQGDPRGQRLLLFHEYFHGDDGRGLGASHQTGWTALIAPLVHFFATTTSAEFLDAGGAGGAAARAGGDARPAAWARGLFADSPAAGAFDRGR